MRKVALKWNLWICYLRDHLARRKHHKEPVTIVWRTQNLYFKVFPWHQNNVQLLLKRYTNYHRGSAMIGLRTQGAEFKVLRCKCLSTHRTDTCMVKWIVCLTIHFTMDSIFDLTNVVMKLFLISWAENNYWKGRGIIKTNM